jgi:hypothetical protein
MQLLLGKKACLRSGSEYANNFESIRIHNPAFSPYISPGFFPLAAGAHHQLSQHRITFVWRSQQVQAWPFVFVVTSSHCSLVVSTCLSSSTLGAWVQSLQHHSKKQFLFHIHGKVFQGRIIVRCRLIKLSWKVIRKRQEKEYSVKYDITFKGKKRRVKTWHWVPIGAMGSPGKDSIVPRPSPSGRERVYTFCYFLNSTYYMLLISVYSTQQPGLFLTLWAYHIHM